MTVTDDSSRFSIHPAVVESSNSNLNEKWNHKNVERLKELIAEQLTTSQIAAVLSRESGIQISRNAVIGKARRLDVPLLGVQSFRARNKSVAATTRPKARTRTLNTLTKIKSPSIAAPTPPTLAEVVANPKNYTILEIQRGECYWPTTLEGATVFCGHSTGDKEKSWCPAHSKLGYAPPYYRQRVG